MVVAMTDDLDRETSLTLYGAWTDMERSPCERCGTPLVLVEQRDSRGYALPPMWREVVRHVDEDACSGVPNVVFGKHICRPDLASWRRGGR